eukprot:TRINITY_DN6473_c0_g1_i1.p1 TRINITY_DN6473_c0_g1~~TRINITY_DN6473_c0_g1_i1.p1  ORF type:complete len:171 (-),score=38.42 TRINITY_DN6473_c0_g1_i1:68-580(-)
MNKSLCVIFIACILLGAVVDAKCQRKSASQCGAEWKSDTLPCGKTVCAVGCAMSSVANALPAKNGKDWTPGSLNTYLKSHKGYEGCLLVWEAVNPLGMTYKGQSKQSLNNLIKIAEDCNQAAIANVRNGGHWVLITGYAGNSTFYVNDPGYNTQTYTYSQMLRESVYRYN